ncbi:type II secretion system F family protein [Sphingosinicella soli]|uniref:Tight adherence protein B n=1 Tax=Sphingosinicella soli TaxID=333708 RepID=A0A7W7F7V8_9SPHN|nr:type II secretion system F family protein [Sphingosinicella soli]MBB4630998.1 tight adherence protein B [Sphingosinicella soli]
MSRDLMIAVIFGGVFVALALIIMMTGDGNAKRGARRLEQLRERHSSSREVLAQVQMRRILASRESRLDTMFQGLIPNRALLRQRLERTGKSWSLGQYAVASIGVLALVFIGVMGAGAPIALAALAGLFFGLFLPHMIVGFFIKKRIKNFNARFPDAIDLLVRGLRSGLPISESIGVVGKEILDPVGYEFRQVSDKIRIGRTMEQALQETANRLTTPEFQFFVITLSIQRETGGNLAETLNNLAEVLRKRAQMKLKIRAMSSESKASAYIVGSLPFIVFTLVYMMNPSYLNPFFIDPRLMVAGVGGLIWMSIGAFIMAKMVSFEI